MIKVSVIVPVYNGEEHLRECLDSIVGQSLNEIEIICVDDGSTDSSFSILKEYQSKDNRVQVLQQKNLYAGVARNLGKKHAKGEYLVFWDCDDFFEADALEKMYIKASGLQADICVCGANKYFNDTKKMALNASGYLNMKYIPGEVFNRKTNEEYILNFTNAVPWNKMFRRQFIEDINIDFQPIRNGNDIYFTQCALVLAERITTINEGLINYRLNQEESLFGTLSKSPLVPFTAWISVAEKLTELNVFPEKSYANKVISSTVYLLRNIKEADAFAEVFNFLKNGGLERLHIQEREEQFYYAKWHCEFVKHLVNDSREDFRAYLSYQTYLQLVQRSAQKSVQDEKIRQQNMKIKDLEKIKQQKEQLEQQLKERQTEVKQLQKKLKKTETERDKIRNSWSYKVGRIIMWLPGKIKKLCFR